MAVKELFKQGQDPFFKKDKFDFKETFGGIPKSVKMFNKTPQYMAYLEENTKVIDGAGSKKKSSLSGQALRFSVYIPDQAVWILKYYTRNGDRILDPFMGRGTRSQMSLLLNREYVGFDTCSETININKRLSDRNGFDSGFTYYHESGTKLKSLEHESDSFECVLTCPPYYNAEVYSGEDGDISHMKMEEFDKEIELMFNNVYRLIKPSNYKKEEFYPVIITIGSKRISDTGLIDMDYNFQRIARSVGFTLHDKLITENKSPIGAFTFRRNYKKKFLQKVHETTLVFLKYNKA